MQIIKHTPVWVFVLFFILLFYGLTQARGRQVQSYRVAILPAVMLLLSLIGVVSSFGASLIGLSAWLVGIGVAQQLGLLARPPRGVRYSYQTKLIYLPGSWVPLVLMMVIFFIKYAVGVVLARHLAFTRTLGFIAPVGFLYGFLSGLFLARAQAAWKVKSRKLDALVS